MSITGIGSGISPVASFNITQSSSRNTSATATGSSSQPDSFHSDFAALLSAVQSGNLSSAQSALTTLQGDMQSATAGYSPSSTSSVAAVAGTPSSSSSSPTSDLDALFQAVQSGDMSGAQAALTQFKTDAQSQTQQAGGHHHHHHHHHGGGGGQPAASTTSSTSSTSSTSDAADPFASIPAA